MLSMDYFQNTRPEIAKNIPNGSQFILEIGCGEGNFSFNFAGYTEYWGVEPFANAASEASQKITRLLYGTYDEVKNEIPDSYFDLIVCNDVIEHIADSDKFLQDIKRKMKPEAYMIGSIPNVRYYENLINLVFKKDWKYSDRGILDNTHVRFFTEL